MSHKKDWYTPINTDEKKSSKRSDHSINEEFKTLRIKVSLLSIKISSIEQQLKSIQEKAVLLENKSFWKSVLNKVRGVFSSSNIKAERIEEYEDSSDEVEINK